MISLYGDYKKPVMEQTKIDITEDVKNSLDNSDLVLLTRLNDLRINLSESSLNIRNIRDQIRSLANFNETRNYEYLSNLLCPEKARGAKIPSLVPVPSCSFQLHNCVTIQTNLSGNCAFILNPNFLASNSLIGKEVDGNSGLTYYVFGGLTSLWVNNDSGLTGNAENNNWIPVDLNQTLPPVYDQYRLVSASVVVKYIGRLDNASGIVGGAIIYDQMDSIGGKVQQKAGTDPFNPSGSSIITTCPELYKYGNFELARDSFYHQENMCIEGVRMLYFPIDNAYEEYTKVTDETTIGMDPEGLQFTVSFDYYKSGFNWMFYCQGAISNSNCFKVDVYCNFECLPKASFLSYMPISVNPFIITPEEKKKFILTIQSRPMSKADEVNYSYEVPDLFYNLMKKFKNGLPGFDRLRACGLIGAIPSFKPGLTLAGSMIASQNLV